MELDGTHLLQCDECGLILRFEDDEFEDFSELPTFCHLIPLDDHESRRKTCKGKRFSKPRGI